MDGNLLSSRRMQASTSVPTTRVHDLLFADDCALNTVTEEDMQRSMDLFSAGCANFGLAICTTETVVMHQLPHSAEYIAPRINVNGTQLKSLETFAYRGSTLSRNTRIDDVVTQRITKASQVFDRVQACVWNLHVINLNTNLKMYKAAVFMTLRYGAENWTVYSSQAMKLNHFHISCLRGILKPRRQDRIPYMEVLERTRILSIHTMLRHVRLQYWGHLKRSVETIAAISEANWIVATKAKLAARKSQAPRINSANAQAQPTCPSCQRTFLARIGLVGHHRTRCRINRITKPSVTPASDASTTTTTTPTTDNNFIDGLTTHDHRHHPPSSTPAPLTATNSTYPTPNTSLATSEYLPPASSTTTGTNPKYN
ncbi:unnamed protein product [Schistocephalus solidus]|uniref:C2H2-type domain-containing protein n=1 Tax=Schistocephalus solidus TaxID=70667 RepID=A0A183SKE8_SCHSO|nr:unnamed protein product [Schistocephalus solidus]